MEIKELIELLKDYNIPIDTWNKGSAKSVEHLLNEINSNESVLKIKNDELIREIEFVGIKIFYLHKEDNPNGVLLTLKEKEQIFSDGRKRTRNIESSVSEKLTIDENPINAAPPTFLPFAILLFV